MLDTLMLFQETLDYQTELAERLGLTNVQNLRPDPADLRAVDPTGTLHQTRHRRLLRDPQGACRSTGRSRAVR